MVHLGDVPASFFKFFSKAASLFLLLACFFILQYLFDLDFICTCKPGVYRHDVLFMTAPPLVLTLVVFIIQFSYSKARCFSCCHDCCNNFCSLFGKFFFQLLCLVVVWASAVLFDGDWYFCLMTNLNRSQTGIPCRENLTYDEILIKTGHKNDSVDLGFLVIFIAVCLWSIGEYLKYCTVRKMRWKRSCASCGDLLCPPYYKWLYEDLLSKEVSSHLKNELKKIAEKKAKGLCEKHITAIRNHELPKEIRNQDGSDGVSGNAQGGSDGNLRGSPHRSPSADPSEDSGGSPGDDPTENLIDNPEVSLSGSPLQNPSGDASDGRYRRNTILDTWQEISISYFYLKYENENSSRNIDC